MVRQLPHIFVGRNDAGWRYKVRSLRNLPAAALQQQSAGLAAMIQQLGSGSTRSDGVWSSCFSEEGVLSDALKMNAIAAEGRWGLGQHGGNRKGDADAKPAAGVDDSADGVWKMQPHGKRKGDA